MVVVEEKIRNVVVVGKTIEMWWWWWWCWYCFAIHEALLYALAVEAKISVLKRGTEDKSKP